MKNAMKWLAFAALAVASQAASDCKYDSGLGASWDFATLQSFTHDAWRVKDFENPDHEYFFGICENTTTFPDNKCDDDAQHEETENLGFSRQAPAWQTVRDSNSGEVSGCYRLGHMKQSDNTPQREFSLIEPEQTYGSVLIPADPAKGVILSYSSGGANDPSGVEGGCEASGGVRKLDIEFQCDELASATLPEDSVIIEDPTCTYRIYVRSIHGCPKECPRTDNGSGLKACAGNGVCGYNYNEKRAQCYCDTGYGGTDCSDTVTPDSAMSSGPMMALLVVMFILVLALLALIGYMCYRARQIVNNEKYVGLLGEVGGPLDSHNGGNINDDNGGTAL